MEPDTPVYLDYAATTPILPEVAQAMVEIFAESANYQLGNASSLHTPGTRGRELVEQARQAVAELIGASPSEIIFTSGGSEANNTVINVFAGQPMAVSAIEHPSVMAPARAHASTLTVIPVDEYGLVESRHNFGAEPNMASPTAPRLVSIMLANNELGTIEPIAKISRWLHSAKTFLHTDATQAVGKIPVNVKQLGVDYLTFSAHKLGGPVGIGALYVRQGAPYHPLILGGHQESRRRAGTTNVAAIVGFGVAARYALAHLADYQKVAALRNQLVRRILHDIPHSQLNSPAASALLPNQLAEQASPDFSHDQSNSPAASALLPNIANFSFPAAEGESIQLMLDAAGISVSTGSACAAGDLAPSPVLMATHHDAERAHSSIRFSLGLATTQRDIDRVMAVLPDVIARLQGISTIKIK